MGSECFSLNVSCTKSTSPVIGEIRDGVERLEDICKACMKRRSLMDIQDNSLRSRLGILATLLTCFLSWREWRPCYDKADPLAVVVCTLSVYPMGYGERSEMSLEYRYLLPLLPLHPSVAGWKPTALRSYCLLRRLDNWWLSHVTLKPRFRNFSFLGKCHYL
jgi:hypothetical protein